MQSQLAELLACERELDQLLAAAREEAHRRVDDARAESASLEAEAEAALEEEVRRVRSAAEERARAAVREILDRARGRVAGFQGVSDEQVEGLAASALRHLIAIDQGS